MKVGYTGTFFSPRIPPTLGHFFNCMILEIRGDRLLVELEDGSTVEIPANEFTPRYVVAADKSQSIE